MRRPLSISASVSGIGQRNPKCRITTEVMVLLLMCGLMPLRVVSTSGNSGMANVRSCVGGFGRDGWPIFVASLSRLACGCATKTLHCDGWQLLAAK